MESRLLRVRVSLTASADGCVERFGHQSKNAVPVQRLGIRSRVQRGSGIFGAMGWRTECRFERFLTIGLQKAEVCWECCLAVLGYIILYEWSLDQPVEMEDEECFQPILSSQEEDNFQQLNTVSVASIPLFLGVFLEICGIVFVSIWPEEQSKCDTYFIYLYLHCAYWLIVMAIDHVIKARHHNLRINGYLDFYQSTYQLIRTPLFITSLWNTCYLLLAVILHHTHKVDYERYCRTSEWFTPLNYIFLLTTLELVIIVPAYINYIKSVMRFNRSRPLPDVTRDEWLSPFTQDSYSGMGEEIGYHQRGRNLEELLEKQADFIRYLRDHNVKLSHRIMLLASHRRATET